MGEWVPFFELSGGVGDLSIHPNICKSLAAAARTPASVALVGLDGAGLARGVTGVAPPQDPTTEDVNQLQLQQQQLWLWSVPLRKATPFAPAVMCLEVSGALRASSSQLKVAKGLGVFGEDDDDDDEQGSSGGDQEAARARLLAATLLSCSTIVQPLLLAKDSSSSEGGGGGAGGSGVEDTLAEWTALQRVIGLVAEETRRGGGMGKDDGDADASSRPPSSPSSSSSSAAASAARTAVHMPRLLFALGAGVGTENTATADTPSGSSSGSGGGQGKKRSARARLESLLQAEEQGFDDDNDAAGAACRRNTARSLLNSLFAPAAAAGSGGDGGGVRDAFVLDASDSASVAAVAQAKEQQQQQQQQGAAVSGKGDDAVVVASLMEAVLSSDIAPRLISLASSTTSSTTSTSSASSSSLSGDETHGCGTVVPASGAMLFAFLEAVTSHLIGSSSSSSSSSSSKHNSGDVGGDGKGKDADDGDGDDDDEPKEEEEEDGLSFVQTAHGAAVQVLIREASSLSLAAWNKEAASRGLLTGTGSSNQTAAALSGGGGGAAAGTSVSSSASTCLLPMDGETLRCAFRACSQVAEKVFVDVTSGAGSSGSGGGASSGGGGGGSLVLSSEAAIGNGLSALRVAVKALEKERALANDAASSLLCGPLALALVGDALKAFQKEAILLRTKQEKDAAAIATASAAASGEDDGATDLDNSIEDDKDNEDDSEEEEDDDDGDGGVLGKASGGNSGGAVSGEAAVAAAVGKAQKVSRAAAQRLEHLKAQLQVAGGGSGAASGSGCGGSNRGSSGGGGGGSGGGGGPFDVAAAAAAAGGGFGGGLVGRYFSSSSLHAPQQQQQQHLGAGGGGRAGAVVVVVDGGGAKGPHAWSSLSHALLLLPTPAGQGDAKTEIENTEEAVEGIVPASSGEGGGKSDDRGSFNKKQQEHEQKHEQQVGLSACAAAPVGTANRAHAQLRLNLLRMLVSARESGAVSRDKLKEVEQGRSEARAKGAASLGECLRKGEREKQELTSAVQGLEMEISEVVSRSERVDALRRKKVATAVGRVAEAKRRANLMNTKVAEMHAVASAKLVAAKDHIAGHGTSLACVEVAALAREKALLEGHAHTLEALLEASQTQLEAKQVKATEVEYQAESALRRGEELKESNAKGASERDHLEDLVLKLKLYTLGGVGAVKSGRPPHTTLPAKLAASLHSYERQCLDDIFAHI